MADIVDPATRSRMMSGIRSKNTRPELAIRCALHAAGFRFRLHARNLPGRPDIVLRKHSAVILVHGCFWHGHNCSLFRLPATRPEFWAMKVERNRANDTRAIWALRAAGWRVGVIWECALRGPDRLETGSALRRLIRWLESRSPAITIRGRKRRAK